MKKIKYLSLFTALCLLFGTSCKEEAYEPESVSSGPITDLTFTPNNGGGYFLYTVPPETDYLYAIAEYRVDNGELIKKSASVYSDTLFIEGFGTVKEYSVSVYAVDRNENRSAPVTVKVTPKVANISEVIKTVSVKQGFSSIVVEWENEQLQSVDIRVRITTEAGESLNIQTSNLEEDEFEIHNLKGVPHNVSVYVTDDYGNETEVVDKGSFTPLIDGYLVKKPWSFLYDHLLYGDKWDDSNDTVKLRKPFAEYLPIYEYDSMKNGLEKNLEADIKKLWDNELDVAADLNLNYFLHFEDIGVWNLVYPYPFSYFIDMGRTIQASRVHVNQRDWWNVSTFYTGENVQSFEIWVSDDADPSDGVLDGWERVGFYKIIKPSDPLEARVEAWMGHTFALYPESPRFTKPFRYLRLKCMEPFVAGHVAGSMSELTLLGVEEDGSLSDPAIDGFTVVSEN